MSQPSRPRTRVSDPRRRRPHRIETIQELEERQLLAPFLPLAPDVVTFTPATTPTNANLGTVTITPGVVGAAAGAAGFLTAAPTTSVSELTPTASFGNDVVRLKAGPGGVFGNGLYAISRGAGANLNGNAINRPGTIYRVDPATGKSSIFFDLNTIFGQNGNAGASVGASTGLVNQYDVAFDPEGYFDGRPSMFVSTADRTDPTKNAIYRIGPDGSFMGMFVDFNDLANAKFNVNPTSILVPPAQDQAFLRGLIAGSGTSTTGGTFSALFFDANAYSPNQKISNATLPVGVNTTGLTRGPQVALAASNPDYLSPVYSAFTDFGTPAGGGVLATPGLSGIQGLGGELLIGSNPLVPAVVTTITAGVGTNDQLPTLNTNFRRFQDLAFDQYGYFSQGFTLAAATTTTGSNTGNTVNGLSISSPVYAGSLFVSDLSTGDSITVTPLAPLPVAPIIVPVQGPGPVGVQSNGAGGVTPIITNGNTTAGGSIGGRILRVDQNGKVTVFAEGFNTSGDIGATSFANSELSITFSADGTTLYASDNDGVWQFKAVTDLAGATSGSYIGLNDLRTLAVPYDGQGAAVAVVDTGVDANSTPFRGRVSPGTNVVTNTFGNTDTAPTTGVAAGGNGAAAKNVVTSIGVDGHGTLVAGVVAQFVPQSTIEPVNIFAPFTTQFTAATATGNNNNNGAAAVGGTTNATTSSQYLWKGLDYVAKHPYVNDPVRPGATSRVIAATLAFGTTETFVSEGQAYRRYPQIVLALKSKLEQFRNLGIAPVGASGQFGAPFLAGATAAGNNGNNNTTTAKSQANNNADNPTIGDNQGMAMPAVLNEVVSVTGTYPFPFQTGPSQTPLNPAVTILPGGFVPILISNGAAVGGTGGSTTATAAAAATGGNNLGLLTAGDFGIFNGQLLGSANRSATTDFGAPAIDVPTFRRTFSASAVTTGTTTTTDARDHNTFTQGGTSLSSAIVAGSFAMVSSALNYWDKLNGQMAGFTADAYLTTPVGVNTLNFGPHSLQNLSAYNNPDGINAILAWTAIPVSDQNNGLSATTPPNLIGSNNPRQFAEISIGNAIAAIEGSIALNYLIAHNDLELIDVNHTGSITAQQVQNFVDGASKKGLAEAGAMARLLGGTARIPTDDETAAGESPDQPDVLQRRFNFFDYAADGQLNGSVTIAQLKMLAHTLLPTPDAYTIVNRQRASANGWLLDPSAQRNFQDLQHIAPNFELVPARQVRKYRNISPTRFGVDKGQRPGTTFPLYTLFAPTRSVNQAVATAAAPAVASTTPAAATATTTTATPATVTPKPTTAPAPAPAGTLAAPAVTLATTTTAPTTAPAPVLTPAQQFVNAAINLQMSQTGLNANPSTAIAPPAPAGTLSTVPSTAPANTTATPAAATGTITPAATPLATPTATAPAVNGLATPQLNSLYTTTQQGQTTNTAQTNALKVTYPPKKSTGFFNSVNKWFKKL